MRLAVNKINTNPEWCGFFGTGGNDLPARDRLTGMVADVAKRVVLINSNEKHEQYPGDLGMT